MQLHRLDVRSKPFFERAVRLLHRDAAQIVDQFARRRVRKSHLLLRGRGGAFLSWVRCEGRVIGGHFNLHAGATVTAWVGATLPEHNDKFPATLLIWTDIEEACRRGAARLDLGGSGGVAGVARFKELLGAQEETRASWEIAAPAYRLWHRLRRPRAGGSAP